MTFSVSQIRLALKSFRFFWIAVVLGLLLNLIYYGLNISGKKRVIAQMKGQYMTTRRQLVSEESQDKQVQSIMAAREDLLSFRKDLPEEWDVDTVAEAIDRLVFQNELSGNIVELNPQGIVDFFFLKYSAEIRAQGTFANLKQMLADLQNLSYLICVHGVSFKNIGEDKAEVSLTISTYFKGNPTQTSEN